MKTTIKICECKNPDIHTDENGINYCKDCKVETELLKKTDIDLFEHYELLPLEVQEILQKYSSLDQDYENLNLCLKELEPYGYEFEYYLNAEPYDLKLMESTKVFELKNNSWIETEFNPESKQICLYDDSLKFKGIGIYTLKNN